MQFLSSYAFLLRNFRRKWNLASFSSSVITQTSSSNLALSEFLRDYGFQKSQIIAITKRHPNIKSLEKPQSVIQYFKNLGLSDTQIRNSIKICPQIIFCNPQKTLEPKIQFFKELGFSGSSLCQFISKKSPLLAVSLQRRLIPSAEILKSIVSHQDLIFILTRCSWLLHKDPYSFLLPNISYLKSCGINGTQLVSLLKRQPRLFISPEETLKGHVIKALELGFSVNSGMLALAIHSLSCVSKETFDRKFQAFVANGFSENETKEMIRKAPGMIRCAEDKLKMGMELYMKKLGIEREALVKRPIILMYSLEMRVKPRLKVLQVLRDKGLLKEKKNMLFQIIWISEKDFMEKYVMRFEDEEVLVAYNKGYSNGELL